MPDEDHARRGLPSCLRRLALPALVAAALPATAQDAQDGAAPSAFPRYTVELIVFTYDERALAGDEIFVPEVPAAGAYGPAGEDAVPVFSDRPLPGAAPDSPVTEAPAGSDPATDAGTPVADSEISGFDEDLADIPLRTQIELTRLPPEAYAMDEIYRRLVELDAYHPIMRAAWTQTAPPQESSPSIRLRALGDPPPGLDGTVTLHQGRFAHLGLDLTLDERAAGALARGAADPERSATDRAIAGSGLTPGTEREAPAFGDPAFEAGGFPALPVRYRLSEVRIVRDGEVRYYDHPRFGVLAKLTRVQERDSTAGRAGPSP